MYNVQSVPLPANEKLRINALQNYGILDSFTEKEYDFITVMASQICHTPVALITLLDNDRQWIKSSFGIELKETTRDMSFCNYTILDAENVNVVPDLRLDERYKTNPLVTGGPKAVFYAGAPLVTPDGFVLGSICVLDAKPGFLSAGQQDALKALARQVITTMELRKNNLRLKITEQKLSAQNKKLKEFAKLVSHDMKTPLANIVMLSKGFRGRYKALLDEHADGYLNLIEHSSLELLKFTEQLLSRSLAAETVRVRKKANALKVLNKTIRLIAPPDDMEVRIKGEFTRMEIDELSLQQIFQNLISNAIKYNDKPKGSITIAGDSDPDFHLFRISDNGRGIASSNLRKIYSQPTIGEADRFGMIGTGIGLPKVKVLLEAVGGYIQVTSKLRVGTDITVAIPRRPIVAANA